MGELWRAPGVVPSLAYRDVEAAVEFLERAFGLRERREARLSGQGLVMTWVEVGDGLINLSTAGGHGLQSPRVNAAATASVKVYVDDVDAHFAIAKAAGAEIVSELEDGFWGGRIYRALDPEGHLWEFSQQGRELSAEQWDLPPGLTRG